MSVEATAVAALSVAIFLALVVWDLAGKVSRKNKELESRIQAVENVSEPFASTLARSGPVPLDGQSM